MLREVMRSDADPILAMAMTRLKYRKNTFRIRFAPLQEGFSDASHIVMDMASQKIVKKLRAGQKHRLKVNEIGVRYSDRSLTFTVTPAVGVALFTRNAIQAEGFPLLLDTTPEQLLTYLHKNKRSLSMV